MSNIFVQIASYRDPELLPTLNSMLVNAKLPENLRIGICRQYHPEDGFDNLDKFSNDKRFKIINILYSNSKGACWARNKIQQLYDGEDYTLQIDSHMRFNKNWDVTLIEMLKQLQAKGIKKPLLTAYAPSYISTNDPEGRCMDVWVQKYWNFAPEGPIMTLPEGVTDKNQLTEPIPSRFYSAHLCFTLGRFCNEVQHDPEFYFHGEEISIAVRAFTHGYDLFHPHKIVAWHEYTRLNRTKHWDDDKEWGLKDKFSFKKNRQLLGIDSENTTVDFGKYGLGNARTLRDYEVYAGILFSKRQVQQYTLDNKYPPNPRVYETEEEWLKSFSSVFKYCLNFSFEEVPEQDYDFWAVIFEDEDNKSLYRQDANEKEIKEIMSICHKYCKIYRNLQLTSKPKRWIVWPHSKSKGWCDRIVGTCQEKSISPTLPIMCYDYGWGKNFYNM